MFWKYVSSMSIITRLLLIFICSMLLVLIIITGLVYPPMRELLHQAQLNHQQYNYLLAQICIKKFFIGLWISSFILICTSYLIAKKSMSPLNKFTQELASINAASLDKRLQVDGHPSELRELAATCNSMLFRIENSFQHIKQFSASMAHELRNPVHYLQTATEITLAKPQTIESYQHLLHTHLEEYQNLTKLIDNLLFLTRSEHGQIQLNRQKLSAKDLINSVVEYYHYTAEEKGVEIQLIGNAEIEVDEHLFKRVISNVIENSMAYTPKSGTITITIEKKTEHCVEISIADNGIGIEKEHLPLLCQGFYRVNHSSNNENAGLGLGLAIANSIMKIHKGQIEIQSQLDIGTTVLIILNNLLR